MVDSISNVPNRRATGGAAANRTQASPVSPADNNRQNDQSPERRAQAMLEALARLIKGESLPKVKFEAEQDPKSGNLVYRTVDAETGQVISQWSAEPLVQLRKNLSEMEGMLIDKMV